MFVFEEECNELPERRFSKGDVVIKEGGQSGALLFLIDGSVEISRSGTVVARTDAPGFVLGEVSVLLDKPHIAEVTALEDTRFYVAEDAEGFLAQHPKVSVFIARSLAKKVDLTTCYLVDLKQQYGDSDGQLGMVHEVIDALLQAKT